MPTEKTHNIETYLGYSVEKDCSTVYVRLSPFFLLSQAPPFPHSVSPFLPSQVPPHPTRPRQVWVLAKHVNYFTGHHSPVDNTTFLEAAKELNIKFVGAWDGAGGFPGVENLSKGKGFGKEEFQKEVVNSRAIIGLG